MSALCDSASFISLNMQLIRVMCLMYAIPPPSTATVLTCCGADVCIARISPPSKLAEAEITGPPEGSESLLNKINTEHVIV